MKKTYFLKLTLTDLILIALFAALMVVGAYLRIQIPLVPITFQAFFCGFAGILLGSKKGAISQILYIIIGLIGIPVFAGGASGPSYVLYPTFGFLIGFIFAAYIIGLIIENAKKLNFLKYFIALLVGLIVINIVGISYFSVIKKLYNISSLYNIFYIYFIKDSILFIVVALISMKIAPIVKKAIAQND